MSRFITTKADFTLRRKHKKGSGATIYENDYTTINPMPNALRGEYVIGDSNFKFTSRLGLNTQKKHTRGKFIPNPSGDTSGWTLDTIIDSGITDETRIRLKPDYTSIRDFACYGSAVKLIQGTVNGVITDFPAELYLSKEDITFYIGDDGVGYSTNEMNPVGISGKSVYNEYGIDIITKNVRPESVYNQLRYFTLCGSSYVFIDEDDNVYDFNGFTIESGQCLGRCYQGKDIEIDHIATTTMSFIKGNNSKTIQIQTLQNYQTGEFYYVESGNATGHIRPKKQIVENYFRDIDDFTAVLLNRDTKPIYKAVFDTPKETETGFVYTQEQYIWTSLNGGFNPDLSGPYFSYLQSLMDLGEFYDKYFTDNMWRSLTHEAIKTLDWTYVSNTDGDTQELEEIDTSRIEPITKIYGRQFDDLKRYADGIKTVNTITYNQKSNMPDYTLTDVLENSGWEVKTLDITTNKDVKTDNLGYSGLTTGYTSADANSEFLRRLKLNSKYLFSVKGTRKGLDSMLGLLGFDPEDYDIHEYIYVARGNGNYQSVCQATNGVNCGVKYPLSRDVATINKYKVNFNTYDPYGEFCGIPVAEVGYTVGEGDDAVNCSYVVPWYSHGKQYDDGLYFQMNGGWGRRENKKVGLEIAPKVSSVTETDDVRIYDETQARIKFALDFDELLQQAAAHSIKNDVFYVTDIGRMKDLYTFKDGQESAAVMSHYFVLEDQELSQFLGYTGGKYGWRSIKQEEVTNNSSTAGTLVLYLESIQDITTGNNPHIGGGMYDDGTAYISGMTNIFGYSLENNSFIGISDETCKKIEGYVFDVERFEDNRKCWFFSDDYNTSSGKNNNEIITFKEKDITDQTCDLNGIVNDIEMLNIGEKNKLNGVGVSADTHFKGDTAIVYERESEIDPFNPEGKDSKNDEAAANSIINVKNMVVNFNITRMVKQAAKSNIKDYKNRLLDYINDTVLPYLTQMIPSTTIVSWSFDGDNM